MTFVIFILMVYRRLIDQIDETEKVSNFMNGDAVFYVFNRRTIEWSICGFYGITEESN